MNQLENKSELTLKIQKIKAIVKALADLEHEENNREAGTISQLLAMIAITFEDVEQRLIALEKKQAIN